MKNTIWMKFPMLIVSPKIWSVCLWEYLVKVYSFILRQRGFQLLFISCLPYSSPQWNEVLSSAKKRKAKYILIDELEIRGEAQTTQGGSWKQEWIAYPNWEWKKLFWRFKEKWLQNKGICLWNLIHMHIIIFPENCCSNLCIPANSYEMKKCGTYVTLLNVCLWNYTKEFSVCFLLLLLLVSIPIETAADQNKTKTK